MSQRIVILGPTYPYRGGIAHHTTILCQTLRRLGHQVKLISYTRQYPKFLYPGRTDQDPSQTQLKIDDTQYLIDSANPLTWIKTARVINKFQPDLLILPWWVAFWAPMNLALLSQIKKPTQILIICHNTQEHESNRVKAYLTKKVLNHADHLLTHSPAETKNLHDILGPQANIITAFHPTYSPLAQSPITKAQAQAQLQVSSPCLLFFGFVRKYKGLDILLEAFRQLQPETNQKRGLALERQRKCLSPFSPQTQATLLIVGEFWKDKQYYLDIINRNNLQPHIRLIDQYIPNEQIAQYFTAADLVVQPYRSATGSGICQLAFGLNRPVIATNVGDLSQVIQDHVNGRIVPPNNPQALAAAIRESLNPQTLKTLTQNAAQTKNQFSWQKLAQLITQSIFPK
ncbi:MAG: glycosyltransferase [Sedimentisphaerales bacterium]|nr:glycosyltransferase [Sedimentisphaerales bacterium]